MILRLLVISIFLSNFLIVQAQQGAELGAFTGVAHYFGDLNTDFQITDPKVAFGIVGRYNFNERVSFKIAGTVSQVAADDIDSNNTFERRRNLNFQSSILDASAQIEFNFLPYIHGSKDQFFTPYLFAGLGITQFNPQTTYCLSDPNLPVGQCPGPTELVDLRPLGTEGQLKVDINYEWSINIELSGRRLFTDYLDDVSTVYPEINDLENFRGDLSVALSDRSLPIPEKIGEPGRQRGNQQNKDSYAFLTVGIVYYFGDLKCPEGN